MSEEKIRPEARFNRHGAAGPLTINVNFFHFGRKLFQAQGRGRGRGFSVKRAVCGMPQDQRNGLGHVRGAVDPGAAGQAFQSLDHGRPLRLNLLVLWIVALGPNNW